MINTDQMRNYLNKGNIPNLFMTIQSLNDAQNQPLSPLEKTKILFQCLSIASEESLKGPYKEICKSALKDRIIERLLESSTRALVVEVSTYSDFKYNVHLKEIIEQINYVARNRFISNYQHGFILNTKFSHQFSKIVKSANNSIGVGLGMIFIGTLSNTLSGVTQVLSPEQPRDTRLGLGISMIGAGSFFTLLPFVEAFIKSGQNTA